MMIIIDKDTRPIDAVKIILECVKEYEIKEAIILNINVWKKRRLVKLARAIYETPGFSDKYGITIVG